jgi:hypothetical protein
MSSTIPVSIENVIWPKSISFPRDGPQPKKRVGVIKANREYFIMDKFLRLKS